MANPRSEILNAKRKLSLIFDKNGSTLEKEDIDEDGGSVKTITKTPASLLEVSAAGNKDHLREMSNNSIANPLGAGVAARAASNSGMDNNVDLVHMDRDLINLYSKKETADSLEKLRSRLADSSFGEPPAEAFGDGPNDLSPHIGKDGRYLTNAEYYGTGQADLWQSPEGREIITHGWGGYDANIVGGYLGTNDQGTLATGDIDAWAAQTAMIEDYNQRDLLDLREKHPEIYAKVLSGEIKLPIGRADPHAGEDYIAQGFKGGSLHSEDTFEKSIVETDSPEVVPENTFDFLSHNAPRDYKDAAVQTDPPPVLYADSSIAEEAEELTNNLKDIPMAPDKGIQLEDVVKTLSEEDPSGEAIKTINEFATWADTVPDEVAIEEAKTYLQGLKDSPTVTQRFRKAMAIAMMAMVFGDDFSTAMNTGFGVIADDYAEEEAEEEKEEAARAAQLEAQNTADIALAKQIAKEDRDLLKTIAAEERALGRQLDSEERAFYKTIAAEQRALTRAITAEQRGNATWADRLVITENIAHQKLLAQLDRAASAETLADAKAITADNFAFIKERGNNKWSTLSSKAMEKFNNVNNFQSQMDGALDWMVRNWSGQVDFGNNANQRVAFEKGFEQWMTDTQRFDTADFATYIQDAFIKNKFTSEETYIEPSLIMPDLARDPSQRTHANETVAKLYKKVETQVIPGVGTEKHALMLLKKDFNHYRDYESNGTKVEEGKVSSRYDKLLKHANKLGEGVFTRFVNQLPASSIWGFVYDPEAKGKSATELGKLSAIYLREH